MELYLQEGLCFGQSMKNGQKEPGFETIQNCNCLKRLYRTKGVLGKTLGSAERLDTVHKICIIVFYYEDLVFLPIILIVFL
jgi:hypothetical protein